MFMFVHFVTFTHELKPLKKFHFEITLLQKVFVNLSLGWWYIMLLSYFNLEVELKSYSSSTLSLLIN